MLSGKVSSTPSPHVSWAPRNPIAAGTLTAPDASGRMRVRST